MRKLFNDEAGFVVSGELVIVLTIGVLAMVVGLTSTRDSILNELVDVSSALGAQNQSFSVASLSKAAGGTPGSGTDFHAKAAGFGFADGKDDCDCKQLILDDVCGKNDPSGVGTDESGN